jgi:hypothetical protein
VGWLVNFTVDELQALRDCQQDYMMDACQVGTRSVATDDVGGYIESFTYGPEIACGLSMTVAIRFNEIVTDKGVVTRADARIRLPFNTVVDETSEIKVTKMKGVAITPLYYNVLGVPAAGDTGTVCFLREVST